MDIVQTTPSSILINKVADWLMDTALEDEDLEAIVRGCCERLSAAGIPITRVQCSFSVLHPLYAAVGFTWRRGEGLETQGFRHSETEEDENRFLKSPYYHLIKHDLEHLRCRLEGGGSNNEFPIFEEFRQQGLTDYLGFMSSFKRGTGKGMVGSWATDRKGGFSDDEIAALLRIQNRLAVTCKQAVQSRLSQSMLETYLGHGAGTRVLDGQIKRGDGETVRAALVMADIRNSTHMAEALGRQAYIDKLNIFFDAVAGPYAEAGGEILSFLGDGFLAAFPCERNRADSTKACRIVLDATEEALERMKHANTIISKGKEDPLGFGIGLHIGNVTFGNVGLADRLTFSVFGSTVNEAARLEALTKTHKTSVIASQNFVDYCGGSWEQIGQERLRGLDATMLVCKLHEKRKRNRVVEFPKAPRQAGNSDAENVVLLHRDSAR